MSENEEWEEYGGCNNINNNMDDDLYDDNYENGYGYGNNNLSSNMLSQSQSQSQYFSQANTKTKGKSKAKTKNNTKTKEKTNTKTKKNTKNYNSDSENEDYNTNIKTNMKTNTNTKSNTNIKINKNPAAPEYKISLNFKNNLFQTYLFEIFEKLGIELIPTEMHINCPNNNNSHSSDSNNISTLPLHNTLSINYNDEISYLLFLEKNSINEWMASNHDITGNYFFSLCEALILDCESKKQSETINTKNNITIIFMEIPPNFEIPLTQSTRITKDDITLFLNTELKLKVLDCYSKSDLIDFISNFTESITKKEEKSKVTFFDTKPVTNTKLCELEGITDEESLIFVKHLMCISGVSERKALAIVKVYPRVVDLMRIYDSSELNVSEKESLLKMVEICDKKVLGLGTKSGIKYIGQAISAKVYKFFSAEDKSVVIS